MCGRALQTGACAKTELAGNGHALASPRPTESETLSRKPWGPELRHALQGALVHANIWKHHSTIMMDAIANTDSTPCPSRPFTIPNWTWRFPHCTELQLFVIYRTSSLSMWPGFQTLHLVPSCTLSNTPHQPACPGSLLD